MASILNYLDNFDIIRFKNLCLSNIVHVNNLFLPESKKETEEGKRLISDTNKKAEQLFSKIVEDFDSPTIHGRYFNIPRETFIRRFIGIDEKQQTINAFETFLHYSLNG